MEEPPARERGEEASLVSDEGHTWFLMVLLERDKRNRLDSLQVDKNGANVESRPLRLVRARY